MPKQETEAKVMALVDHAREKRMEQKRALCPVCKLSAEVRRQLAEAGDRGITRKEQVAWLKEAVGADITISQLTTHFSGRHDE